ncbi:MAG: ABC transporter permease, partial [Archaeoglobaceae archaeon]
GCGLKEYEEKMVRAQARLERWEKEFQYLDGPLGIPVRMGKDEKAVSLLPIFLRPPRGINISPENFREPRFGLMFTFTAVVIGMVYDYFPFMVLPLYASLEKLKRSQLEASYILGASPLKTFLKVTLPHSKPGIVAGIMLVFIPSFGEFVVPSMLGGTYVTIGTLTWDLFLRYHDWWRGSAISVIYMAIVLIAIAIYMKKAGRIEL